MPDSDPNGDVGAKPDTRPLPTFEDLAKQRRLLKEFCDLHVQSVERFSATVRESGKDEAEVQIYNLTLGGEAPKEFRHITSSATCYDSLRECPKRPPDFQERAKQFARKALPHDRWKSDDSAEIYCRCRGLPFVLDQLGKEELAEFKLNILDHLDVIFAQLLEDPKRLAIGEAYLRNEKLKREDWYPPNAYHTYWTLELLSVLQDKAPAITEEFSQQRGAQAGG